MGWNAGPVPEQGGHFLIGRPRGLMQTIVFQLEGSESLRLFSFSYGNSFIAGFLLIIKVIDVHSQYISGAP